MTEAPPALPPPETPSPPSATACPPSTVSERLVLALAVAALLGVVVLAGFVWRNADRLADMRQEFALRLAESEAAKREAQLDARQNREAIERLQAKMGALEDRLAEMQSQQMALEAMYQELSRGREERLLAELEQDVAIAAQQLQLAGNVEAALIALSGAEARLAKNGQPQFLPLRRLIARDIERLKALPGADVPGIALRIDGILNAVPNLPLAFERRPDEKRTEKVSPPAKGEKAVGAVLPASAFADMLRAWGKELWGELRRLVRIERIDRPDPGLLSPREVFFLRENLKLRLLSARIALLARDGRSFKSDIDQARRWLEAYFDLSAPAVQDARAALEALGKLDVTREPVMLAETLSALRNFKLARDRR